MKWVIELGEHEIEYLTRWAIKGQALANFLDEMVVVEKKNNTTIREEA